MGIIGIAANPASGKDIRRLVSHATVFDNNEKTNIIQRILRTVNAMGPHQVYLMPDRYNFGARLLKKTEQNSQNMPDGLFEILDMPSTETAQDTTEFALKMNQIGASVLIVLGGDGTCRAAAKGVGDLPMIPVSTGTNNAYPRMCEGTAVGMAAAALAGGYAAARCAQRDKRIEIYKNKDLVDIALVDAAFTHQLYSGTKAVWDPEEIEQVAVTHCHPSNIGFSSLLGCKTCVSRQDDYGAMAYLHQGEAQKAAFSAGMVELVQVGEIQKLPLNQKIPIVTKQEGMVALDGEKEVFYQKDDELEICVTRQGPLCVDIKAVLEEAQETGFFNQHLKKGEGT